MPDIADVIAALQPACVYCGDPATHREHVIPRSRGGTLTLPACAPCNLSKGKRTPTEWMIAMTMHQLAGDPPLRMQQIVENVRPGLVDQDAVDAAIREHRIDLVRIAWYAFTFENELTELDRFVEFVRDAVTCIVLEDHS